MSTVLTLSDEQLSLNLFDQIAEARNMRHHPYLVVDDCLKYIDKTDRPGERMIVRWQTGNHSLPTALEHGFEQINDTATPTLTPGYQAWGIIVQPIFISAIDEKKNQGGVIPVLRTRVDAVEKHFKQQFQNVLMKGALASGTWAGVPAWEAFLSLNGADQPLGIIEDQADGTNVLHGISKASYPLATHEHFHNSYFDAANDASANLLNNMYAVGVKKRLRMGEMQGGSSIWYVSENAANFLKQALRSFEQYVSDGDMDDGKRRVTMYDGIPCRPIAEMPTIGSGSTTNPWSAVLVDWKEGVRFRGVNGWVFDYDGFEKLPGTAGARYSLGKLWGNLVGQQPGACGLVVDAETF